MGSSSRDLLHLEHKNFSTTSSLESTLLVCKKDSASDAKNPPPNGKPTTNPVPQSQVMGKVRDFLGVISEANKRLHQDAKDNSQNYDIEALDGTESELIEMDLMLGIADLHTPEAISAAESAISSGQALVPLGSDSSETESEDESDETSSDDGDEKTCSSPKHKAFKHSKDGTSQTVRNTRSKKRQKIIEIS